MLTGDEIAVALEIGRTIGRCPPDLLSLALARAETYAVMFGKRRAQGTERTATIDLVLHLIDQTAAQEASSRIGAAAFIRRSLRPLLDRLRPSGEIEEAAVSAARRGHAIGVHVFAPANALEEDEARDIARDEMLASMQAARRRGRVRVG